MSLQATCPNCRKTYQVPDNLAGHTVMCRACRISFTISAGGDTPIDLAPAEATGARPAKPAYQARPEYSTAEEPTAPPPGWLKPLLFIAGPLDWNLWFFLLLLVGATLAFAFTGSGTLTACSLFVAGLIFIFSGAMWAARVMMEEGVPLWRIFTIFLGPLFFLAFFYSTLVAGWEAYRRAVWCQIRGMILILAVFILPALVGPKGPDGRAPATAASQPVAAGEAVRMDQGGGRQS